MSTKPKQKAAKKLLASYEWAQISPREKAPNRVYLPDPDWDTDYYLITEGVKAKKKKDGK